MKFNRTSNAKRNMIWSLFNKIVVVTGSFLIRTLLVYCLGAEYLGLNSLYLSILQVLNLAELGFSSAVIFSMYEPIAKDDHETVSALLNYFKKIYRIVGSLILVIGLCIAPFLGYLIEGTTPDTVNIQIGFLIYLANAALTYFLFAYRQALITAYQRGDIYNKIFSTSQFIQYALQALCLLVLHDFYLFLACTILMTFTNNVLIFVVSNKMFPEYRALEKKRLQISEVEQKRTRKRVTGLLVNKLCRVTRDSFDNVIISAFLGLVTVAAYGNYFCIFSAIYGIVSSIVPSITAVVGNCVVEESKETNLENLRKMVFSYALISIIAVSCTFALFQSFMKLWMGEQMVLPDIIPILVCLYFYIRTMGDVRAVYVDATGLWWVQIGRCIVESITNILFSLVLVNVIGLAGVILGTILSLFFVNFCYGSHLLFKHYFGLKKSRLYYTDHAIYFVAAVGVSVVVYFSASFITIASWPVFIAACLGLLVEAIILVLLCFGWTQRFRKTFIRKKTKGFSCV